jgi:hypothetical protein
MSTVAYLGVVTMMLSRVKSRPKRMLMLQNWVVACRQRRKGSHAWALDWYEQYAVHTFQYHSVVANRMQSGGHMLVLVVLMLLHRHVRTKVRPIEFLAIPMDWVPMHAPSTGVPWPELPHESAALTTNDDDAPRIAW